jgi:uncharacterized repeat protein (TIGR01451 family)
VEPRQLLATFTVSSVADSGPNTLRQEILDSNATPGPNIIQFNIPGPGPYSIAPTSDLPPISNTVTIDGTTQPGYTNSPIIELNGSLDTGSGNTGNGLTINAPGSTIRGLVINRFNGIGITLGNVSGGTIAGNFIGTDPSGTIAEGNRTGGINVGASTTVTIGGLASTDGNLISGNRNEGIYFFSSSGNASGNLVEGNYIGTNLTGATALPNTGDGIYIGSTGNQIGGVAPGQANTIKFNGLAGVRVGSFNTQTGIIANPIRGNAIFGNSALGIDLGNSGVTLNGSYGTGFGPNWLQSFPVINSAYLSTGGVTVEGQLQSTPNSSFTIDFYANNSADPSGFGQGQRYIGSATVTTNPSGVASFTKSLMTTISAGELITATATDRNNNTSEFSSATSVTTTALADLNLSLFASPNPVFAGSDLTYYVNVTNNGPSQATNVTITDPIPSGATFRSAATSQGTYTVTNGVLTANLGKLALGQSASLQFVVRPSTEGPLSNTATVKSDQTDILPDNNTATINTTVSPAVPADLAIGGFPSQPQATVGQDVTLTVVVANFGPSNQAQGVMVTDTLPTNATFVSATPSQGTVDVSDVSNGTLTADLGSLLLGANATIQIVLRPTSPGRMTNVATVQGAQADPNALNNTTTIEVGVIPPTSADLSVSVVALPNPVTVGHPLSYTIDVTNNGPGDTGGVTLTDQLDSGVTFVSANPSQGTATASGGVVTANLGTLIAGQSVLVTIVVTPTAIGTLSNTATVQGDQPDFIPANNQVTITSQVSQDTTPPTILAQRLIVSRHAITGIVLTFSQPMDPVQAEALNNYGLFHSGNGNTQGSPIPLASAQYDPSSRTVTLAPASPLPLGRFYEITANGQGASGLTDTSGNVLDGDQNGYPDGIYKSFIGRGTPTRPIPFQRSQFIPIPPPPPHHTSLAFLSSRPQLIAPTQSDITIAQSPTKHVNRNP